MYPFHTFDVIKILRLSNILSSLARQWKCGTTYMYKERLHNPRILWFGGRLGFTSMISQYQINLKYTFSLKNPVSNKITD